MKLVRALDPIEIRVLGCLLEKQQATPEYYPLTLNGALMACNQKTNREPVMDLAEADVLGALDRLQYQRLVFKVLGSRSVHWEHRIDQTWGLDAPSTAVLTLLLLRGAQTPGELRARSDRLHLFGSLDEVEQTLAQMAKTPEPLLREIPRRPGQKEIRWTHLLAQPVDVLGAHRVSATDAAAAAGTAIEEAPLARIQRLEELVAGLAADLAELKRKLGDE